MIHIKTLLRISIFCTLFTLALSNQAFSKSKKDVVEDSKSALENAEKGGIVLGMSSTAKCGLTLNKVDSKQPIQMATKYKVKMKDHSRNSYFGLTLLEPGKYNLSSGKCIVHGHQQKTTYYYNFKEWYEPFDVKGGEVLYLGHAEFKNISYQVDGVLDFVPNFLIKPPKDNYLTYSVINGFKETMEAFKKKAKRWAWILPYMKEDILIVRLDEEVVKRIIGDSYKSSVGENKRIDGRLARSKVNRAYLKYLLTGNYDPS